MSPVPQEHRLAVGGLSCAACARRAERALAETEGVLTAHVSFAAETASVAVES
ncbi:MAG: cation transporter, partial [Myxococcota bacterium]